MGAYHGKAGFDEFSHRRSIMYRTTALPLLALQLPNKGRYPKALYEMAVKMAVTGFFPKGFADKLKMLAAAAALLLVYRRARL